MKIPLPLEATIQAQFFDQLRLYEHRFPELKWFFAIPNGGHRHKATAGKLKMQGVKAGIWDTFLPVPRNGFHGLWIEFKRSPRHSLTDSQHDFGMFLIEQKYQRLIATSWQQGWSMTCEYLEIKI